MLRAFAVRNSRTRRKIKAFARPIPSRLCRLAPAEDIECDYSHQLGIARRRFLVLRRNVVVASIRRVVLAVRGQALRNTDARAVELADDPLLFRRRRALRRREDEVTGPPKRDRLVRQAERGHDLVDVVRQELLRQVREQRLVRTVIRVDRSGAADCRDAALLRLLVDDPDELRPDHVVPELTLNDARAEALVHDLPTGRLAALQVLALALGDPGAGLVRATGDAPLDELRHRVLLGVVVVRLHQVKHLGVLTGPLAESLAVVARLELDDPDTFAGRPAVLLDHARLERHRLLEALDEGRLIVVRQRVLETDVQVRDLRERVLRAHELHHVRRRPGLDARLLQRADGVVELRLAAAILPNLTRVATHDQRVELRANREELVVLLMQIVDRLAAHPGPDHTVHERNRVVAVAVAALVGAAVRRTAHVDLEERRLELRFLRLREHAHVVLGDHCQARQIDRASATEDVECDSPHQLGIDHRRFFVLGRDVVPAGIWRVLLAIRGQALRDTDAGAVELADDPLLFRRRRALRRCKDEVTGPPQRNRLIRQAERRHDLVDVVRQELRRQVRELRLLRTVVRVDRPGAADRRDAALLRLLVDDPDKLRPDHVIPELALNDARAEALVHDLPAGRLAALQVLALPLGSPRARRVRASGNAPLDELRDRVLLGVVVVRLHQIQHLAVLAAAFAEGRAVVARLQLDDPDALSR